MLLRLGPRHCGQSVALPDCASSPIEEAVSIAFDVGNRHFTLACEGDVLLVPDDLAMEQLVSRLGVPWERREVVYAPLGGGPDD